MNSVCNKSKEECFLWKSGSCGVSVPCEHCFRTPVLSQLKNTFVCIYEYINIFGISTVCDPPLAKKNPLKSRAGQRGGDPSEARSEQRAKRGSPVPPPTPRGMPFSAGSCPGQRLPPTAGVRRPGSNPASKKIREEQFLGEKNFGLGGGSRTVDMPYMYRYIDILYTCIYHVNLPIYCGGAAPGVVVPLRWEGASLRGVEDHFAARVHRAGHQRQ